MKYLALDVETANANYSSICQIGIATFENGEIIDKWKTLVNPETFFDDFNVFIHGIKEIDVINSPTFETIYSEIKNRIEGQIVVHHMPFDRVAINRACEEYNLSSIDVNWLDSAKIVRRAWNQFAKKGYGLQNVADFLDIQFEHHDALQDAIVAGLIVEKACQETKTSINDWLIDLTQLEHFSKINKIMKILSI
ncbi:MAG: 3'-5' exonuclease [Candidatus Cloacimonetes bacterium]|jgi:DNA polymerase III subunit epsilon|nr:3'-5' exonuclease [Prolixibacteraceae bacterium]MBT6993760.1 3'-5' exonuclease [Candidatus Cloacimonadota bacterium]